MISNLNLDNYNYSLRNDKIAKYHKSKRDDSKLLVYKESKFINQKFYNIDKNIPQIRQFFLTIQKLLMLDLYLKTERMQNLNFQ